MALMKQTELKPGKPPKAGKGPKRGGKIRKKAKPKGRRGRLEAETEARQKKAYQGVPCIICLFEGKINTRGTCGHHIVPKSRCRAGRHDPANIVPLCPTHHKMGNDCCPHSSNPLASAHFDRWLERWMPKRFAATRILDQIARGGSKYQISAVEGDRAFWAVMEATSSGYTAICAATDVEAYADGKAKLDEGEQ